VTSAADPLEVPARPAALTFPGAATPWRHVRLSWSRYVSDPGAALRGSGICLVLLVGAVVFMALRSPRSLPGVGFVMVVAVVLSFCVIAALWRRGGGAERQLVVRSGGIELVTATWRAWYPADEVVRWSLDRKAFRVELRGIGTASFDATGSTADEAAIASLLAAPATADLEVPWREAARWRSTPDTVRQAMLARQLAPGRRSPIVAVAGAVFVVAVVTQWVGAASAGGAVAFDSILIRSTVVTAILVGIVYVSGNRSYTSRVTGDELTLLVEPATFAIIRSNWAPTRVPWSAVQRARVGAEWVELVTGQPHVSFAIPTWAFLPAERAAFVDRLPPPMGDDGGDGSRSDQPTRG